jgi:hypothetical protein
MRMSFPFVETKLVSLFKAGAITVWPFIFVHPDLANDPATLKHENIHYNQQKKWAKWGLYLPGLLAWFALYLLVLPVGWNPFRYKWESEAYEKGNGFWLVKIKEMMKKPPYYLWWM